MLFSFAVRAVYVESCSMFTRGGVYRVVKEALGGTFAKLSVSALMFDYILTGPISGVSAGQYITGLLNELIAVCANHGYLPVALMPSPSHSLFQFDMNHTSAVFAAVVTIYYWWENTKGIEESSEKAMKVMQITTVMVVILLAWGLYSVYVQGSHLPPLPTAGNMSFSEDSLGFLKGTKFVPVLGLFGILMAFGHSVLAMSGEESLAQGQSRDRAPKTQKPQTRSHRHRHLQLRLHRRRNPAGLNAHPRRAANPHLSGQPDRRSGHVHERVPKSSRSASASSSSSSDF